MNTVIILGVVQCLLLTFLVLSKTNKGMPDLWLAVFLIFNALLLLFFYANFNIEYLKYQKVLIAGSGFPLLSGPLFFIYVSSFVRKTPMRLWFLIIHFLPYLLFCLTFYYFHLFQPQLTGMKVYDGFIHAYAKGLIWPIRNVTILFAISSGAYLLVTLLLLRRHTKNIYNEFSYIDKINLNWVKYWILFSLVSFVIAFFVILIAVDHNYIDKHVTAFKVIAIIITVQVFFIGYYGLKQSTIFSNIDLAKNMEPDNLVKKPEEKYIGSKLDEKTVKMHLAILLDTMNDKKLYLNGDLSIAMLSEQLGTSSHHLSQILNDQLKKNFFDFVNEYRVEEVKAKLVDPQYAHITLLGLAYDCGFNSKSSFNSVFKKVTSFTPSQYKKQHIG